MTRLVIKQVEDLAAKQGITSLKFYNRKRQPVILENADLLAGVGGIVNVVEKLFNYRSGRTW